MSAIDEVIAKITRKASEELKSDEEDFEVVDYAGTNVDDAYEIGVDTGEVLFARHLMKIMVGLR